MHKMGSSKYVTRPVDVGGVLVGGKDGLKIMAGPCAVESRDQVERVAALLDEMGVKIMRGGAFKPRTSPYAFQGMGEEGLDLLWTTAERHGLKVVSEVMDTGQLDAVARRAHLIQVGARSMNNTCLLKALGERGLPVLLKRGYASSLDELLMASEYIMKAGNSKVLLCERGIRTFESATRFTLDISAVAVLKRRTDLPVVVDPSHAAGDAELVPALAKAAVAAGADALLLEVHPKPERALCDSKQALSFGDFRALVPALHRIRAVSGGEAQNPRPEAPGKEKTVQNPLL
jgi:3-deoxy-7-phosphoheptulonate synthase